jgi:hypothetical protein
VIWAMLVTGVVGIVFPATSGHRIEFPRPTLTTLALSPPSVVPFVTVANGFTSVDGPRRFEFRPRICGEFNLPVLRVRRWRTPTDDGVCMKRRNWALLVLCAIGLLGFVLSRTVWGPPSRAAAYDPPIEFKEDANQEMSDAQRRYLSNQPRHWRYIMLKRN